MAERPPWRTLVALPGPTLLFVQVVVLVVFRALQGQL